MKLKINKACDLGSISVLPPRRTGGSGGVGASGSSAAAAAVASQQRSQTLSQQSFSQGGGGSGIASSLLHSQSQLSQASLDENLLSLHLASPTRDQASCPSHSSSPSPRFGSHDDSSKKMPSLPVNSASCVREESQLQLAKISSNPVHRWNPSLPDGQATNEDVERKFQHLASSVHKMGMVLDSVQNDVMQLNRAMKEASLDSGSIQQKVVLLDSSLQKILKGQDDLKALIENSTKSNADQLSVLNSHSSKLDDISSTLSIWPKKVEADLRQLQSDIFRIFTKEMEGIVRAIRSLNSRPSAMGMPTGPKLHNQRKAADEPTTISKCKASGEPNTSSKPGEPNTCSNPGEPNTCSTWRTTGEPNTNSKWKTSDEPNTRSKWKTPDEPKTRSKWKAPDEPKNSSKRNAPDERNTCSKWTSSYEPSTSTKNFHPAPSVCPAKVADPKPKVEQGKAKALPQKLTGSRLEKKMTGSNHRVTPKLEEVPIIKFTQQVATKKAPVMIILDSDDDSEGRASCVTLKATPVEKESDWMAEATEESLEILRRARKRRRRENIVPKLM
ncbi:hypothetical protein ACP70R_016996 [Stipagrostis hirtigluma subsp. patula]